MCNTWYASSMELGCSLYDVFSVCWKNIKCFDIHVRVCACLCVRLCVCVGVHEFTRASLFISSSSPTLSANHFSCNHPHNKLFRRPWNLTLLHISAPAVIPLKCSPPPPALTRFPPPQNSPVLPNNLFQTPSPTEKLQLLFILKFEECCFTLTVMYRCAHPHRAGLMCT